MHASSRRQGPGLIDVALKRLGKQRRSVLRVPCHLSLAHLVAASDLAASMPRSLASAHALRAVPLPLATPLAEIHAFWHTSADSDGGSLWFREQMLGCGLAGLSGVAGGIG